MVHDADGLLLGCYERPGEEESRSVRDDTLLVGDGRIYGAVAGSLVAPIAGPGSGWELAHEVLLREGPTGLAGIAGDYAISLHDRRAGRVVLARDPFGLRPLFWARRGSRIGFSCEPEFLIDLGLASGELSRPVLTAYLARRDLVDRRTAFEGVWAIRPGWWLTFDSKGWMSQGRWFRPEDVEERPWRLDDAAEAVAQVLAEAVGSRLRGRTGAIGLSGGRDSGAVAVAARRAGESVVCLTQRFDADLGLSEEAAARRLARDQGHEWRAVPVSSRPRRADVEALPEIFGTPTAPPAFPLSLSLVQAAVDAGAQTYLDGMGGEPLFSAPPVVVLDLIRRGRFQAAIVAARNYQRLWTYPYPMHLKAAVRALMPRPVLAIRERHRPVAPWVGEPVPRGIDPVTAPRSARAHLISALLRVGGPVEDAIARPFAHQGIEYTHPLLDLRVVSLALSLPAALRAPVPGPKPVLAADLLTSFDSDRIKMTFPAYFQRLARGLQGDHADMFGPATASVRAGLVRPGGLRDVASSRWAWASLALVPVEMWLRFR
ncbi:MAG TPA: asparagine synthase-related protein [Actinomycetota bacterium]|nr:asparagine synthase-related protein [Actinomycetota bacterium]